MFSSLDRIDVVATGKDGRKRYVQTDHRTAEEIEREPALSVLFALARVLNAKRMGSDDTPEPLVVYSSQGEPPEFLRRAVLTAGGQLAVGADVRPAPDGGGAPPLEEVIASAFADLARAVAAEHGVGLNAEGLEAVERAAAEAAGNPEEDEIAYWSAVMKLGSFGGELIRTSNGGRWIAVDSGTLPFALSTRFRGEEAVVNPLGKAIKRFANGEEDSLAWLVNVICSQP